MGITTNRPLLRWLLTIAFLAAVLVLALMNTPRNINTPRIQQLERRIEKLEKDAGK